MKISMYEGYIRNRKQLEKELSLPGCADRRKAELAVLYAGYQRWGHEIGSHLYGSFAFVIQDDEKEELFGIRDHFGLEPFYYSLTEDGRLLFGTKPAALTDGQVCPQGNGVSSVLEKEKGRTGLDREALLLYMCFGYPVGDRTLYQGVRKLMPGRYLLVKKGKLHIYTYYKPAFCPDHRVSEEEWTYRIEQTFRMILKEDAGNFDFSRGASFLSGGVDSSYMLACSGLRQAYGIGYNEKGISEAELAAATASKLGASFREILISSEDYMKAIPRLMRQTELPTADASTVALYLGCSRVAADLGPGKGFCLSGEGADEFFAGYHVYGRVEELGRKDSPPYYGCYGVMTSEDAGRLLGMEGRKPLSDGDPGPDLSDPFRSLRSCINNDHEDCEPLSRMLLSDIALWFEGDILFGAGRAARENGLQVLMPYADRRMFELAAQIPSALKRKEGCGKYILRKTALKRLPYETAFRRKVGFSVPVRSWFGRETYRNRIEEVLFGKISELYFDQNLLKRYWTNFLSGNENVWTIIYTVYTFLLWYGSL